MTLMFTDKKIRVDLRYSRHQCSMIDFHGFGWTERVMLTPLKICYWCHPPGGGWHQFIFIGSGVRRLANMNLLLMC